MKSWIKNQTHKTTTTYFVGYDPPTGNCLSKTYADGSIIAYTYTPDNLPLRTIYPSGKWRENVYDAQRRLCGVVYSSSDMDYELQLDAYGNATNVEDAAGNNWRYDYGFNSILLRDEFISMGGTQFIASATTNSISRKYDSFDRSAGFAFVVNDEPKCSIGYAYDDDGDLTHIVATNAAGRSFSVAYTNVAGYSCGYTITTPDGDTIRRAVDRDACRRSLVTNCATYFNSSPVDSNRYAFDALSRPTARTAWATGGSPVDSTFAYNDRSEVVSAVIGTNHFTHAYDDIGNHLLFGDNDVTNTYAHNNLNQITTSHRPPASPRTIHHNADGGLSSDGIWTYAYDAEDQLTSVTSRSLTNGALRVRNAYDYRRRRTSKTVQRLHVTTAPPPSLPVELREWETCEERTFVYDDWNLIHETVYAIEGSVTNITEVQYFWGLDLSGTLQGAGGVGGLLAVSRNGQLYFPTFDNNGNVTKYIDESGNIVAAYEYDDFGRTISQSGPLADFFRHRFSTKYCDLKINLYYYNDRFYSPELMRWFNRDPIEEGGGINLYAFANNSGIRVIDVFGESPYVIGEQEPERKTVLVTGTWNTIPAPTGTWLIQMRARLTVMGGRLYKSWPDAAAHLDHFLKNTGTPLEVRFRNMNRESPEARVHLYKEINDALCFAERLADNDRAIVMVTPKETGAENKQGNWLYAVGQYTTWARASVVRCGNSFSMNWHFYFRDIYDWEMNNGKGGGLVTDREMALLHRYGRAREFEMNGRQFIHFEWKLGQRMNSGVKAVGL